MQRASNERSIRRDRLNDWNPRATPYPDQSIATLFEAQADRTPDAIAVEHGRSTVTYRALEESANRLANRLRREGGARGTLRQRFR